LVLKYAQVFKDDDDNDNDSDDVEDVSVHAPWITRRYPRRQAIRLRTEKLESEALAPAERRPVAREGVLPFRIAASSGILIAPTRL
jgi:hypothetical protein